MPFYCVLVHGEGIRVETPGEERAVAAFYTSRRVWASSEVRAREKATVSVRNLWAGAKYSRVNSGQPPVLSVESCEVIGLVRWLAVPNKGHTFYPEEERAV